MQSIYHLKEEHITHSGFSVTLAPGEKSPPPPFLTDARPPKAGPQKKLNGVTENNRRIRKQKSCFGAGGVFSA